MSPATRDRKVHVQFPDGRGGIVCGAKRAHLVSADPTEVTCQVCRAFVERHPDRFKRSSP